MPICAMVYESITQKDQHTWYTFSFLKTFQGNSVIELGVILNIFTTGGIIEVEFGESAITIKSGDTTLQSIQYGSAM